MPSRLVLSLLPYQVYLIQKEKKSWKIRTEETLLSWGKWLRLAYCCVLPTLNQDYIACMPPRASSHLIPVKVCLSWVALLTSNGTLTIHTAPASNSRRISRNPKYLQQCIREELENTLQMRERMNILSLEEQQKCCLCSQLSNQKLEIEIT